MNSAQTFLQVDAKLLAVEALPDGSTAIVDERTKTVHSLNPSAAMVFAACAQGATIEQIEARLQQEVGHAVDPEIVLDAISQLQGADLIISDAPISGALADQNRRSALKAIGTFGAMAVPVVLTLTATEQKAFAQSSGSGTTTPAPTTTRLNA